MVPRFCSADCLLTSLLPTSNLREFLLGVPMNPCHDPALQSEDFPLIPLPLFAGRRSLDRERPVPTVESWLMTQEVEDDTDHFLDQLLLDGTARAMREQEIETARGKICSLQPRDWSLHSLDLPLRDPFADDNAMWPGEPTTSEGYTSTSLTTESSDRSALSRPNIFTDFALQETLANYEIRIRRTPRRPSELIGPISHAP